MLYILTPYPGTPIYEQLEREGRLLARQRDHYGWANAVFRPAHMTPEELEKGVQRTYDNLFHFFKRRAPMQILEVAAGLRCATRGCSCASGGR